LYWGKIIGTLAGLATTKPLLALLGLILGHQFDRGFESHFRRFREQGEQAIGLSEAFIRALFRCMGHLAKIDGRVTEEEIRAARAVMHRVGLNPAQVRHAIHWFNEGKAPAFRLDGAVRELAGHGARRDDERRVFLRLLLEVAFAKGRVSRDERAAIWTVCTALGIGRVELAQLEAMIRAQKGFRRSPAGDADAARLRAAYTTLGVDSTATNEEIKRAYRRQMNRSHPDKIAGSNPTSAALADAERRTREVLGAYELLRVRRSIR
jgi:DnaJ like chaperone protein